MGIDQFGGLAQRIADRSTRRGFLGRFGAGLGGVLAASAGVAVPGRVAALGATPVSDAGTAEGYLVVRRYRLQPGADFGELVNRINEGYVPLIRDIPGFAEYLLVDPGDGGFDAHARFADQAGADESTRRAAGWAEQNVADLIDLPAFELIAGSVRLLVSGGQASGAPIASPTAG